MSSWNKILAYRREYDKNTEDHFVPSPNGGTFRKEAFILVNGYDERIKKGQETELGRRFSDFGLKIWYMHIPQGTHDFELNTTKDMIQRAYSSGKSMGHLLLLSLFEKNNKNLLSFRKGAIRNLTFHSLLFALLMVLIIIGGPLYILIWIVLFMIYYPLRALVVLRNKTWNYKLYNISMGYFSLFSFFGMFGFFIYYTKLRLKGVQLFRSKIGLNIKR